MSNIDLIAAVAHVTAVSAANPADNKAQANHVPLASIAGLPRARCGFDSI